MGAFDPIGSLSRNRALLAIFVVALAVRCAYIPSDPYPYDQSAPQGEMAHNIIRHGRWFVFNARAGTLLNELRSRERRPINPAEVNYSGVEKHPEWRPEISEVVGPAAVLAAVWTVTGSERYVYGEIAQIAVDALVVLLVYRISMLLFRRRRAALVAAALYALFPPIARQASIVAPDIWGTDFTVAVVAAYLQAYHSSHRLRWLALCGLLVGVGAYFRPNVLILPAALALAALPWEGWRALRGAVAVTCVACILLVPWTIRNYNDFHRLIPTRTGSGQVLWQGLGEIHNDFGALNNDSATFERVHRVHPKLVDGTPAYDDYLRKLAVKAIERHPFFYAELVAHRIVLSTILLYDSAWMYGGGESLIAYKARTGRGVFSYIVRRPFELLESLLEPAVFTLAMLALVLTWRRRRREHLLLIAAVLAALVPYWLLHFEARYAYPATFAYLVWLGLGVDLLLVRLSRNRQPDAGSAHRPPRRLTASASGSPNV